MNKDTRTDEELNRIIHRWLGFVPSEPLIDGQIFTYGHRPDNSWGEIVITDYCSDLNAIHEAVKKLPEGPYTWWSNHLMQIVGTHLKSVNAGARERAEALVAVIESTKL
jgi:hypothetical protein